MPFVDEMTGPFVFALGLFGNLVATWIQDLLGSVFRSCLASFFVVVLAAAACFVHPGRHIQGQDAGMKTVRRYLRRREDRRSREGREK